MSEAAINDNETESHRLWRMFALVLHGDHHHAEWLEARFDTPDQWLDEAEATLKKQRRPNMMSAPRDACQIKGYRYCWATIQLIFRDHSLTEIENILDDVVHEMGERGAPV